MISRRKGVARLVDIKVMEQIRDLTIPHVCFKV